MVGLDIHTWQKLSNNIISIDNGRYFSQEKRFFYGTESPGNTKIFKHDGIDINRRDFVRQDKAIAGIRCRVEGAKGMQSLSAAYNGVEVTVFFHDDGRMENSAVANRIPENFVPGNIPGRGNGVSKIREVDERNIYRSGTCVQVHWAGRKVKRRYSLGGKPP